jgi:hypothetical protein
MERWTVVWYKLLLNNMNGNMHIVILNMYKDTKSCIAYNNVNSNFFYCNNGVRQGENMSTFLFALYLNDLVKPVLLYGCELWGYGNCDIIERVHLKFCKMLLHMKSSTPSFMVYGELGRYPLTIDIKICMVSYWAKFIDGRQSNFLIFYINYVLLSLA